MIFGHNCEFADHKIFVITLTYKTKPPNLTNYMERKVVNPRLSQLAPVQT